MRKHTRLRQWQRVRSPYHFLSVCMPCRRQKEGKWSDATCDVIHPPKDQYTLPLIIASFSRQDTVERLSMYVCNQLGDGDLTIGGSCLASSMLDISGSAWSVAAEPPYPKDFCVGLLGHRTLSEDAGSVPAFERAV